MKIEPVDIQEILFAEDGGEDQNPDGDQSPENGDPEGSEEDDDPEGDPVGDPEEGNSDEEDPNGDPEDEDPNGNPEDEDPDAGDGLIPQLAEHMGISAEEIGEFEEDFEGLAKFTTHAASKMVESEFEKLFKAMPDVQEYIGYRAKGGNPENYFKTLSGASAYADIKLSEGNESQQTQIVRDDLKSQGYDDEEIEEALEEYKDAGMLFNQSKRSLKRLNKSKSQAKDTLLKAQQDQENARIEEANKHWKSVESTVKEGKLGAIKIPETEKENFLKWMNEPDASGKTARDKDLKELDIQSQLALEYLAFKKFDFTKLVENKARTLNAQKYKKGQKNQKPSRTSSATGKRGSKRLPSIQEFL